MRYYVLAIQYNKEAKAENRTAPKGFDSLNDAKKEFHSQLARDMGNSTLGWSLCMVINEYGGIFAQERYKAEVEPEVVDIPTEE